MDSLNAAAQLSGMLFGAAAGPPTLTDAAYQNLYKAHCGSITTDVALKWSDVLPSPDLVPNYQAADDLLRFTMANGIQLKGHNCCWNESNPTWLWKDDSSGVAPFGALQIPVAQAKQIFEEHITQKVGRYKGQIKVWDVVNEPIEPAHGRPDFLRSKLWTVVWGPFYIEHALRLAHAADPDCKLFINQQDLDWPANITHRLGLLQLIDNLQAKNVPLHGIGFESHLNLGQGVSHEGIIWLMREIEKRGLDVHISEMDVSAIGGGVGVPSGSSNELIDATVAHQARLYLKDMLAFPNVKQLITWELSDKYSDLVPEGQIRGLPFDTDMQPKAFAMELLHALRGRQK